MRNILLNTIFMIFLVITLVLFTLYYMIDSVEIDFDNDEINEITGTMQSFEVFHEYPNIYYPTKKNTERYDEKLFEYLGHIQEQRDNTFHKGKVFLREK